VLKLVTINFSKMLFLFIISSLFLSHPVYQHSVANGFGYFAHYAMSCRLSLHGTVGLYYTSNTPKNRTFCANSKLIGLQLAYQKTSGCYTLQTSPKHSVLLLTDIVQHLYMNQQKFGPIYRMWNGRKPEVYLHRPEDVEVSCSRKVLFFTFIDIRVHYLFLT